MFLGATAAQLRETFDLVIARIDAGDFTGCPTDTGFGPETVAAIDGYAAGTITLADAERALDAFLEASNT